MAYFRCQQGSSSGGAGATITVTYDSTFYNKTMTCSNGTKTYTKTTTSSGSTTFNVNEEGTWTITCNGVSVTVAVVLSYSTQMIPTGSTATPVNDIQTWLKCGGIFDKTYTTISQVLADKTTLLALISDSNAVDYMVRSTNWASSVCANSTAMTYIGNNNYCADTLLADSTWKTAICNSTYIESVLKVKVPTMTSNTTPSGQVYSSTYYSSSYLPWYAFDGNTNTVWNTSSSDSFGNAYIGYKFTSPVKIYAVKLTDASRIDKLKIVGSNDNFATKVTLKDDVAGTTDTSPTKIEVLTPSTSYNCYGIVIKSAKSGWVMQDLTVAELQFYGR